MHGLRNLAFGLLAMSVGSVTFADEPPRKVTETLARELIATMKLHEQAVQKVETQILSMCRARKCDVDFRQCLMKFDRDEISDSLQRDVEKALTPEEMRQAIAYFRSEAGLKHLDILRAEQGLGGDDTLFNQAPEVRAQMLAFLDTRAGYLVITRNVLTAGADSRIERSARMAFWECKPGS